MTARYSNIKSYERISAEEILLRETYSGVVDSDQTQHVVVLGTGYAAGDLVFIETVDSTGLVIEIGTFTNGYQIVQGGKDYGNNTYVQTSTSGLGVGFTITVGSTTGVDTHTDINELFINTTTQTKKSSDSHLLNGQNPNFYLDLANASGTLDGDRFNDASHGDRAGGSSHALAEDEFVDTVATINEGSLGVGYSDGTDQVLETLNTTGTGSGCTVRVDVTGGAINTGYSIEDIGSGYVIGDILTIVDTTLTPTTLAAFTVVTVITTGDDGFLSSGKSKQLTDLEGFVREDYTTVTTQVVAGNGLVNGGALSGDVTLDVNVGDGIAIASDAIAVDNTVVRSQDGYEMTTDLDFNGNLVTGLPDTAPDDRSAAVSFDYLTSQYITDISGNGLIVHNSGAVDTVTEVLLGTGYSPDGSHTGVATTSVHGTGLTLNFNVTSGSIVTGSIVINAQGANYQVDPVDVITITGGSATITVASIGTSDIQVNVPAIATASPALNSDSGALVVDILETVALESVDADRVVENDDRILLHRGSDNINTNVTRRQFVANLAGAAINFDTHFDVITATNNAISIIQEGGKVATFSFTSPAGDTEHRVGDILDFTSTAYDPSNPNNREEPHNLKLLVDAVEQDGDVITVDVTEQGIDYQNLETYNTTPVDNLSAAGLTVLLTTTTGYVSDLTLTSPGTNGYVSGSGINLIGSVSGIGLRATIETDLDLVSTATITESGTGYDDGIEDVIVGLVNQLVNRNIGDVQPTGIYEDQVMVGGTGSGLTVDYEVVDTNVLEISILSNGSNLTGRSVQDGSTSGSVTGSGLTVDYELIGTIVNSALDRYGVGYDINSYINVPVIGGTGSGLTVDFDVVGGGVGNVDINDAGTGIPNPIYENVSTVGAGVGGSGSGLTVTVEVESGSVTHITMVNNGIGYQADAGQTSLISIDGAIGDLSDVSFYISEVGNTIDVSSYSTDTSVAFGYSTSDDNLEISGFDGTTISVDQVSGAILESVVINAPGTGYLTTDTSIEIDGLASTLLSIASTGGNIDATTVEVASRGSNYELTDPSVGIISEITLTAGGTGYGITGTYTNRSTTSASGGDGCLVDIIVVSGVITAVSLASGGNGYEVPFSITINGGTTDATFVVDTIISVDGIYIENNSTSVFDIDELWGDATAQGLTVRIVTDRTEVSHGEITEGGSLYTVGTTYDTSGSSGSDFRLTVDSVINDAIDELNATITDAGSGYIIGRGVNTGTTSSGTGTGATVNFSTDVGQPDGFALLAQGTGYSSGLTYQTSSLTDPNTDGSPKGLEVQVDVNLDGTVTGVNVISSGFGYDYNEIIQILGGDFNCTISVTGFETSNGEVTSIVISNRGSGYAVNEVLTVEEPSGPSTNKATITVASVKDGVINEVTINQSGSGYNIGDIVYLGDITNNPDRSEFTVTTLGIGSEGAVTSAIPVINESDNGLEYVTGNTVVVDNGVEPCLLTLGVGVGQITDILITTGNNGINYVLNETLTVTQADSTSDATITVTTENGKIDSAIPVSSGTNYVVGDIIDVVPPMGAVDNITFVPATNGGSGYSDAIGVATTALSGGQSLTVNITTVGGAVTAVTINNRGYSYLDSETITITGGAVGDLATFNVNGLATLTGSTGQIEVIDANDNGSVTQMSIYIADGYTFDGIGYSAGVTYEQSSSTGSGADVDITVDVIADIVTEDGLGIDFHNTITESSSSNDDDLILIYDSVDLIYKRIKKTDLIGSLGTSVILRGALLIPDGSNHHLPDAPFTPSEPESWAWVINDEANTFQDPTLPAPKFEDDDPDNWTWGHIRTQVAPSVGIGDISPDGYQYIAFGTDDLINTDENGSSSTIGSLGEEVFYDGDTLIWVGSSWLRQSSGVSGVTTFNGRRGDILPLSNDYYANMIGVDGFGLFPNAFTAQEALETISSGTVHTTADSHQTIGGDKTFIDRVIISGGASGTPSLTFTSDNTTGIYTSSIGELDIACSGTNILNITSTTSTFTGNVVVDGTVESDGMASDIRLKSNIKKIPNALDKVMNINGYTYDKTVDGKSKHETGVIAQEVREVFPEVVIEGKDGMLSVQYANMVGLLVESVKELKSEIDELKEEIKQLKG